MSDGSRARDREALELFLAARTLARAHESVGEAGRAAALRAKPADSP